MPALEVPLFHLREHVLDHLKVETILSGALEHCDVVELRSGATAYIVRRPGLALTIPTQWRIYDALVPVTSRSLGGDQASYWAQRRKEGYLERLAEFVLVADPVGTLVGWTGFHLLRYDDYSVVFVDSTGMVPEHQGRGTLFGLLRSRIYDAAMPRCPDRRPVYLAACSENPVAYRGMSNMLLEGELLFPHPAVATPNAVKKIASRIAIWLGQTELYEPKTQMLGGSTNAHLLVGRLR